MARNRHSRLDGISDRIWSRESNPGATFRLDLPGEEDAYGTFRRQKLFHYIFAGGLRQTRAERREHPELAARAFVVKLFVALSAFWLLFRFI